MLLRKAETELLRCGQCIVIHPQRKAFTATIQMLQMVKVVGPLRLRHSHSRLLACFPITQQFSRSRLVPQALVYDRIKAVLRCTCLIKRCKVITSLHALHVGRHKRITRIGVMQRWCKQVIAVGSKRPLYPRLGIVQTLWCAHCRLRFKMNIVAAKQVSTHHLRLGHTEHRVTHRLRGNDHICTTIG